MRRWLLPVIIMIIALAVLVGVWRLSNRVPAEPKNEFLDQLPVQTQNPQPAGRNVVPGY